MNKAITAFATVVLSGILFITQASAQCTIKYWGDYAGQIATGETRRTGQATLQLWNNLTGNTPCAQTSNCCTLVNNGSGGFWLGVCAKSSSANGAISYDLYYPNGHIDRNASWDVVCQPITGQVSGDMREGVTISIIQSSCGGEAVVIDSTTTDSTGAYSLDMPAKGSYAIRAKKTGYTFSPEQHAVIVPDGVSNPLNFAATINP